MKDIQTLIKFLSNLGLNFEQSKIYLTLMENGGQTILQVSRNSKISRTNVYRHTEELKKRGLVEEISKDDKKILLAVGADRLELLIKEEESKVEFLKKVLPELSKFLTTTSSVSQPGVRVTLYQGQDGLNQLFWNATKATKEIVGYSFKHHSEIMGGEFAKKWNDELSIKNLKFRDLVSDTYLASVKEHENKMNYHKYSFITRYVPSNILDISQQFLIYSDVILYYGHHEEEPYGIEIQNSKIAKMQKQIFEIIWNVAQELTPSADNRVPTAKYSVEIK